MDVTQSGCVQVLHCVHVFFVVVGNTPRSGPSAHELAVLALPGYPRHQNIIAYREMRQSLAATAARITSRIMRSTVALVRALLSTENR